MGSENNNQGSWAGIITYEGDAIGVDVLSQTPSFACSASESMASASSQGSRTFITEGSIFDVDI